MTFGNYKFFPSIKFSVKLKGFTTPRWYRTGRRCKIGFKNKLTLSPEWSSKIEWLYKIVANVQHVAVGWTLNCGVNEPQNLNGVEYQWGDETTIKMTLSHHWVITSHKNYEKFCNFFFSEVIGWKGHRSVWSFTNNWNILGFTLASELWHFTRKWCRESVQNLTLDLLILFHDEAREEYNCVVWHLMN